LEFLWFLCPRNIETFWTYRQFVIFLFGKRKRRLTKLMLWVVFARVLNEFTNYVSVGLRPLYFTWDRCSALFSIDWLTYCINILSYIDFIIVRTWGPIRTLKNALTISANLAICSTQNNSSYNFIPYFSHFMIME
jgi:hypothetical protein